jgi:glucan phosphoethanolaminetransferase (alkaline phosphatase superfamily)
MGKFYGDFTGEEDKAKCLIRGQSSRKIKWDIFIAFLLIGVCIVIPFRLAFSDDSGAKVQSDSSIAWDIVYYIMDFFFFLDMIFAFFTTTSDAKKATEVTELKKIAKNYLTGWFFIDLVSIIPFDLALSQLQSS